MLHAQQPHWGWRFPARFEAPFHVSMLALKHVPLWLLLQLLHGFTNGTSAEDLRNVLSAAATVIAAAIALWLHQ